MELKKKYRLLLEGDILLADPFEEYPQGSITYIGVGRQALEFDELEELEIYLAEENIVAEK